MRLIWWQFETDKDHVTPLDFSNVTFMDVSCADEMLNKLIMRIRSGELGGRYVTVRGANTSSSYSGVVAATRKAR